ncbi:MAG TPA: putative Ig domain-containing protein [Tepidisphaeraceae bacterium]|jgi:alpha-galactosidase
MKFLRPITLFITATFFLGCTCTHKTTVQSSRGTSPHINYPRVYGERPGRPFLFTIPATGDEPITFIARGLPPGLSLDKHTGRISGTAENAGEYKVHLTARNAAGTDHQIFVIKIGDQLALTPPLGWNSWNCFAGAVDQDKVEAQGRAMVASGLIKHGWSYINIDDTWQGARTGPDHALQPNEKFPDIQKLCDEIHGMGLKAGIYSTPWMQSYARYAGGSADNPDGIFKKDDRENGRNPSSEGEYRFMKADARQWAAWGFDYLKYDWNPITPEQTKEMGDALHESGRDFIYSLSNAAPFKGAADWAKLANSWRTTGDIRDTWQSMTSNGFSQDKWAEYAGPGHWNDPDMLVVGYVGWGPKLHPTQLTHDEQVTHITLWCLLASPMLIGCDMTKLDDFTLSLLTNDEVLAIDQDPLGKEARRIAVDEQAGTEVWARPLADGTMAVGLFNRGRYEIGEPSERHHKGDSERGWRLIDRMAHSSQPFDSEEQAKAALQSTEHAANVSVSLSDLHLTGPQAARDLWNHRDLPAVTDTLTITVPAHGAAMVKIGSPSGQ